MKYYPVSRRHILPLAIAASLGTLSAPTALAQTEGLVLEEVLVTARKRVESMQDVACLLYTSDAADD